MAAVSCSSPATVTEVSGTRIMVDSVYDSRPDSAAEAFIKPYKHVVDSIMSPVVGRTARSMSGGRPESLLSNLLADIMVWAGKDYGEKPVAGVYNMGGIRASLPAGTVTYGDVLEVAPFDNKICFLTLSGRDLLRLFGEMAAVGGEGVSHGVELVVSRDGKLKSARLNGQDVRPEADYRIATINYLAEGNDKLTAFRSRRDLNSPQAEENDMRNIISGYFREMARQGKTVDARIEGRIRVE